MPALLLRPRTFLALFLGWLALLFYLSSRSLPPGGPQITHVDKVAHFGYFALGGILLTGALHPREGRQGMSPAATVVVVITLGLAAIGALDEWHQLSTPGRTGGDPADWLADCLGALAGSLLAVGIARRLARRSGS